MFWCRLADYRLIIFYNNFCRVNFLKYQKPEKDLSFLKNSETYRTIHHMGNQENGIAKRPAVVASEEDILKVKRLLEYRVPYHQI